MQEKKFYLGLDIGSNSVGIACTDENYNLLRAHGKDCWAVRLFDESKTASERRIQRASRRRLARRKYRINALQSLFAPYMDDKLFFLRLNNSQFWTDDKDDALNGNKNNLFADDAFDDKAYHKKFPTIFHLRLFLQNERATDLRLYYLVIHHIVKYRGHFLYEGSMQDIRSISGLFTALNVVCENTFPEVVPYFDVNLSEQAKSILTDKKCGVKTKCQRLEQLFGAQSACQKEIIKCIVGAKAAPKNIFGERYSDEKSFSFRDLSDEAFEAMSAVYGDDYSLLEAARNVYNFTLFENLLAGNDCFSSAMVGLYDKHKADLTKLKTVVRKYASQDEYDRLFKSVKEAANYANYIGYTKKGGEKKNVSKCKYEDFLAYVKKFVVGLNVEDDENVSAILAEIENGTFMPKILNADSGVVPHQVNEDELNKIVARMVEAFPETVQIADKIKRLFLFRIPYYVGPLTGSNSWVVKNEKGTPVTPWNFDEVVNKAASNEEFMRRMTNKCSYLREEQVLPKASIIYQRFNTLNQLNKLQINQCPVSVKLKQKIFDELFLTKPRVSDKMIVDLLVREGVVAETQRSQVTLSGKDDEFKATMSSYIQLKRILGNFVDDDLSNGGSVCENIILWHTLNTDKTIVEQLILKNYGNIPVVKENVKQLKGLTFKDFGRLSKKFLTELYTVDKVTGEAHSISDLLYETNQNLNEIIFNERYDFAEQIRRENDESEQVTYKDIEKMYVSPAVRRGIWQSLQMVEEYAQALGKAPDKIFVEVTREEGVKGDAGRTKSRKKALQGKYKGIPNIEEIAQELNSDKVDNLRLRSERLYLYFCQLGRCMYTGQRIDLSALNTDMYDVDHILPRSYVKDDSLDNKVLVLRSKNAEKSATYPLPQGFTSQQPMWKMLLEKKLISDKTYKLLTRTQPLGEGDYQDFINRQKVITDQTSKAVVELLQRKYPSTKVVFSKAKNVSDFKQKFDLFKCRETNDLHHARDAYLNVVVGNVFNTCFSTPMSMFYQSGDAWKTYNLKTMFTRNVSGAWDENSLATVKKVFCANSMAVTQYAFCNKGKFYDQTVYSGDKNVTVPRKGKGPLANAERYGGYKGQSTAYFTIVESDGKKGRIKTIEAIPVLVDYQSKSDPSRIGRYLADELGLVNAQIIVPKIKNRQLISYNGSLGYISGITGSQIQLHSAMQLYTDNKTDEYVNQLSKLVEMDKSGQVDRSQSQYVVKTNRMGEVKLVVSSERNVQLYDELTSKLDLPIYKGISAFQTFKQSLMQGKELFLRANVVTQATVLLQVLKFFKCNAERADLTAIGASKNSGTILINKNITDARFEIISMSPCGLSVRKKSV